MSANLVAVSAIMDTPKANGEPRFLFSKWAFRGIFKRVRSKSPLSLLYERGEPNLVLARMGESRGPEMPCPAGHSQE